VARALAEHGLVEVLCYPFVGPGAHDSLGEPEGDPRRTALRLANPLSDEQPELRTSILPPLLEALRRNLGRGHTDLALFEIGLVVLPESAPPPAPRWRGQT
jgi:phenylalanyl-tRNA synthetase beta chain